MWKKISRISVLLERQLAEFNQCNNILMIMVGSTDNRAMWNWYIYIPRVSGFVQHCHLTELISNHVSQCKFGPRFPIYEMMPIVPHAINVSELYASIIIMTRTM